jgi:hypothetical protein
MSPHLIFQSRSVQLTRLRCLATAVAVGAVALGLIGGGCPGTTDPTLSDTQLQQVQTVVQDQATSPAEATQIAENVLQSELATPRAVDWSTITNTPADQNTTYSAGDGLALSGTTFSVAPAGVTTGMLAPGAVTADKLAAGVIPAPSSGTPADGSVTTAKIVNGAVTFAKLAADVFANLAASLPTGSIDGSKLANDAVTSATIHDGTITTADLADNCVTSPKIKDLEVNTADLADDAVTAAKIAAGTITGAEIAAETITGANIAAGSVNGDRLSDASVVSDKLVSVDGAKLDPATVAGDKLAAGTVGSRELADVFELGSAAPPVAGRMKVRNPDGHIVADISAIVGPTGKAGGILMYANSQNPGAYMVADLGANSGEIGVSNSAGKPTAKLVGHYADPNDPNIAGPVVQILNDDPTTLGERVVLGATPAGFLRLKDPNGMTTIRLKGDSGDICITGAINPVGGCDLAETFDHREAGVAQPGMVMVIDPTSAGRLTISTQAYDRKVAGIISGAGGLKPGVKLGQTSAGADHPLALAGRVYCYVDATSQAVEIGDLLTTSDTPGYAMPATDRERAFGAVLGKAMEPLPQGEKGLILVLVALQ